MRFLVILVLLIPLLNAYSNPTFDEINSILQDRDQCALNEINERKELISQNTPNLSVFKLTHNYKFILFYKNDCPHCKKFNPILKSYAENSGIPLQTFTFDLATPDFPNSTLADPVLIQQYFGGNQVVVPTLFIMNTVNLHVFLVAQGELTYLDLATRMNELAPKILQVEESAHG